MVAGKWDWFMERQQEGWFWAFDGRTGIPSRWSLRPDSSLGLLWWTKNPLNLINHHSTVMPYRNHVNITLTGWHEVEKGVPPVEKTVELMKEAVKIFGSENVTWRFSPVPIVSDVVDRFRSIVGALGATLPSSVMVSFLQKNDFMEDGRSNEKRLEILNSLRNASPISVRLCAEDPMGGFEKAICAPSAMFGFETDKEQCGCGVAVEPFGSQESCVYGCRYCYAADKTISQKKTNTTKRSLDILR